MGVVLEEETGLAVRQSRQDVKWMLFGLSAILPVVEENLNSWQDTNHEQTNYYNRGRLRSSSSLQ